MKHTTENLDAKQLANQFLDGDLDSKQDWDRLIADSEAKACYERYQMIGGLMRQEAMTPDISIADSVMSALANEATVLAPQAQPTETKPEEAEILSFPRRFGKQIGGFAIAASVAMVALVNSNSLTQNTQQAGQAQTFLASASGETSATSLDRAQLEQAHQLFMNVSQLQGGTLPAIQTVSNQKAVAIKVPLKSSQPKTETEKKLSDKTQTENN